MNANSAKYDKQYKNFVYTEELVPGSQLTVEDMFEMGGEHFANYYIDDREVEGFVDYVRNLDVLVLRVHSPEGELVLTDVSIVLPQYNQLYGSFANGTGTIKTVHPASTPVYRLAAGHRKTVCVITTWARWTTTATKPCS